jgi:outer membrane protein OmpA-like peptidoglycan-associated protein
MRNSINKVVLTVGLGVVVAGAALVGLAQDKVADQAAKTAAKVTIAKGVKQKITGVIIQRDADTFILRDKSNGEVTVRLQNSTKVLEKKSNIFRNARIYGTTNLVRGLTVEIEGKGDAEGQLVAEKIRFTDNALVAVQAAETRVTPVEGRVDVTEKRLEESEANAKRLADQLIEIDSISKKATASARTAQDAAEAASVGVESTNRRIDTLVSSLDEYVPKRDISVNFKVGSAKLLPEATQLLDEVARQAKSEKAYLIEITGFASAEGSAEKNRRLSQDRAEAVVRYFAENHEIPLRRMITPYGFGTARPVASNETRTGREQNRRVEVKILVNKGLTAPPPPVRVTRPSTKGE